MRKPVNLHQAKAQLSRVVDDAAAGPEVTITKDGVPLQGAPHRRTAGLFRARVRIGADFDAPLQVSIAATFSGDEA